MSIPYSGTFQRSHGIVSAIAKQLRFINLKPVKKVTVTFDPFAKNISSTRDFLAFITFPKISLTNLNCIVKTDVICDRRPAEIKFLLTPEAQEQLKVKEVKFISNNLTALEILQLYNKHITPLTPKEKPVITLQTKSAKKSAGASRTSIRKK